MSRRSSRILCIEPDPARAEALCAGLGDGFELAWAPTVEEALPGLQADEHDAVVLSVSEDPRSSEGTGPRELLDAVRLLRNRFERLPVVALGTEGDETLAARALREGARDYLSRAMLDRAGPEILARALRYALGRQRLLEELDRARMLGLHLAHHDTLTDLPNRQHFRSRLRQLIAQARRNPATLAVLFLDLDRFKQINDTLGHNVGDRILQEVARRLERCVRETDTAARRGGDEFTIILDGVRRGQDAARVARKVLTAIALPYLLEGQELYVSASIGISLFPADGGDVDTLVKHADIAMYRAKSRGGNNFQFYLPDMNDRALERLELERRLHQALERRELVLHYQPQVDLAEHRIVGVEALVRWNHPDLGLVYPDEFIPLAEDTGLIVPLGDYVLKEACRQARAWQDEGLPPVPVSVNVSARQFQLGRSVERVREALEETGLQARWLTLELTESAVMKDPGLAIDALSELREMGVSIAIDDFGTGHSSLAYLKRFPLTHLKIDKTFVRTLLVDPRDAAITRAIIGMAHSLGLRAVAEGVETESQLEFLRAPRCDELQGYLFSPPKPSEETAEMLARGILR